MTFLLLVGTMSMDHDTTILTPSRPQQCLSAMVSSYSLLKIKGITIQTIGLKMDGSGDHSETQNGLRFGFQMAQQACTNIRCGSPNVKCSHLFCMPRAKHCVLAMYALQHALCNSAPSILQVQCVLLVEGCMFVVEIAAETHL